MNDCSYHETYENLWNEKDEDLIVLCKTCRSRVRQLPTTKVAGLKRLELTSLSLN